MSLELGQYTSIGLRLFRNGVKTNHGRIVLGGMVVGLLYLPTWLWSLGEFIFSGAIFPFATLAAAYVGLSLLWQSRQTLSQLAPSCLHKRLGHSAIWFGMALFPFCQDKVWAKAGVWALLLAAIALSFWGIAFFRRHWCPALLILLSTYPSIFLSLPRGLWELTTAPQSLEHFTAWASGCLLSLVGYSVVVEGIFIFLPTGGVSVEPGCTGFEMVTTILSISLLSGIVFQLSWQKTLVLAFQGATLALGLNLARVAIMTIAAADWGDQVFNFWHGLWGGQIFAGLLFTMYYYLVVWMLPHPSQAYGDKLRESSTLQ